MEDATLEHLEHREHAEHAAHSGEPLIIKVSVTIAILAVVAATVGSLETIESGAALSKKSESAIVQNRATDQWSYFQAQSIKKNMFDRHRHHRHHHTRPAMALVRLDDAGCCGNSGRTLRLSGLSAGRSKPRLTGLPL